MVAGDFHGAAWRRQSGIDPRLLSIIEEAFVKNKLTIATRSHIVEAGGVPGEWSDV